MKFVKKMSFVALFLFLASLSSTALASEPVTKLLKSEKPVTMTLAHAGSAGSAEFHPLRRLGLQKIRGRGLCGKDFRQDHAGRATRGFRRRC